MRIEHLHVKDRVDTDLDVIPRDANLFGNIERLLLQAMPVGDALDERNQNVKSGMERAAVPAETLDDVRALMRNHSRGPRDDNQDHNCKRNEDIRDMHAGGSV